jgi:hypothetical protein
MLANLRWLGDFQRHAQGAQCLFREAAGRAAIYRKEIISTEFAVWHLPGV